ncbi:MAG: site-specific integrase [Ruminococcus sp.]|nr:site-specific integrase [Ruminococcus sp.]
MKARLPFKYIISEKNGKLYVIFDFKDDNGKRKRKWIGTGLLANCSKKALNSRTSEIIAEFYDDYCSGKATAVTEKVKKKTSLLDGDPRTPCNTVIPTDKCFKFTDFLYYWLESIKATIAYTSYNGYQYTLGTIKRYFDDNYPDLLLDDLTALQIQKFYNDMYNEGKTGNTVKHYHANLHKALKYAVKMDMLDANPADKVELPKLEKFRANFYSKEEINQLLKVFEGDRMELVVNIAAFYGLRRSEVIGLKWDAIDFEAGTLSVCRKVTSIFDDGHEQLRVDETLKTEASVRTLPLIPHIEKMLKKRLMLEMHYSQMLKSEFDRTFDGFVCRDNTGAIITPEYVTRHFKAVIKKYNLRPLRFHDLRHSCASLLLANGVPMKAIQDWLGHSTFNVTANYYSHLDYQSRISSAEVISNALGDINEEDEKNDTNEKTGS